MSPQPTPAANQNDPGQQAADTGYYRQVLHDLIGMGTDLARLLHGQATTQAQPAQQAANPHPTPPTVPTPDIIAAFDRIARAVRRSITLARSLAEPVPPANDPAQHRAAARNHIIRAVEDVIQRTSHATDAPDAESESLTAELHDRLDAPDLDDDLSHRPIAEIITEICRDLGLASSPGNDPWTRRTPADIAQLSARAAAPSRARHPPRRASPHPTQQPDRRPGRSHRHDPAPPNPLSHPLAPATQRLIKVPKMRRPKESGARPCGSTAPPTTCMTGRASLLTPHSSKNSAAPISPAPRRPASNRRSSTRLIFPEIVFGSSANSIRFTRL